MTEWRASGALARALLVSGVGLALALVLGRPVAVVLVAPLVVMGAAGLLNKPRERPLVLPGTTYPVLHEGQGTTSRLEIEPADETEFVTRVAAQAEHVALRPVSGVLGHLVDRPRPLHISPRRWGQRRIGEEKVALFSRWAGYRWGPVAFVGREVSVLPTAAAYDATAAAPQPISPIGCGAAARATARSSPRSVRTTRATGCDGSTGASRCGPARCTWCPPGRRRTPPCS